MALQLSYPNPYLWKSSNSIQVRAMSSSDGAPLRRPAVPPSPSAAPTVKQPEPTPAVSTSGSSPITPVAAAAESTGGVTVEFQRQRAKELQEYFLDKKVEGQVAQGKIFGWSRKNEIGNGRWAMFGIAVGMLTEFATGSSFVDQLKIIVSNLGIADLD